MYHQISKQKKQSSKTNVVKWISGGRVHLLALIVQHTSFVVGKRVFFTSSGEVVLAFPPPDSRRATIFLLALRFCKSNPCPHNTRHSMISILHLFGTFTFLPVSSLPCIYNVKLSCPLILHINQYNNSQNEITCCPSHQLERVHLNGP